MDNFSASCYQKDKKEVTIKALESYQNIFIE